MYIWWSNFIFTWYWKYKFYKIGWYYKRRIETYKWKSSMVLVELCERCKKVDCKCAFKIKHYLNDNIKGVGSYISPNILFKEKALTTKRIFSNV